MASPTTFRGLAHERRFGAGRGGARLFIDIEQACEVVREIAGRIPVRPGEDGVPIAELSLNEEMLLAQAANGQFQSGVVAGA